MKKLALIACAVTSIQQGFAMEDMEYMKVIVDAYKDRKNPYVRIDWLETQYEYVIQNVSPKKPGMDIPFEEDAYGRNKHKSFSEIYIYTSEGNINKFTDADKILVAIYVPEKIDGKRVRIQETQIGQDGKVKGKPVFANLYSPFLNFEVHIASGVIMPRCCSHLFASREKRYFFNVALDKYDNFQTTVSSLKKIQLDKVDMTHVTDMNSMFNNCRQLTNLDLSSINTKNVEDMSGMFSYCYRLKTLNLGESFKITKTKEMSFMFFDCKNLECIDSAKFDTSSVTDMDYMFFGCKKLKQLQMTCNFNTKNVKNMQWMFSDCGNLKELDLSSFNTENVTDMSHMFSSCYKLENVNLSSFNTGNVTNMSDMFSFCYKLENVNLNSFNTGNVESMSDMFHSCCSIQSLDLSNFNTGRCVSMRSMFENCSKLSHLDISRFDTKYTIYMQAMFANVETLNADELKIGTDFSLSKNALELKEEIEVLPGNKCHKILVPYERKREMDGMLEGLPDDTKKKLQKLMVE